MIALVLFIVFFVLWLASTVPAGESRLGPYSNWCALICVGILGYVVFHGRFQAVVKSDAVIRVPYAAWERTKAFAGKRGRKLREVTAEALDQYIERESSRKPRRA